MQAPVDCHSIRIKFIKHLFEKINVEKYKENLFSGLSFTQWLKNKKVYFSLSGNY